MPVLLLLLLAAPEHPLRAHLRALCTCDVLSYEVDAEPAPDGLRVRCAVRLRGTARGPVRLFLSPGARNLSARRGGGTARAALGIGGLEALVRAVAPTAGIAPTLLTLEPGLEEGEEATYELEYLWAPPAGGFAYADARGVQTHLSGWWLPVLPDELFHATLRVRGDLRAIATGDREGEENLFRTREPVQVLALVAGEFRVQAAERGGRRLEAWLPPGCGADAGALLDDLDAALSALARFFGEGAPERFALVVEPRAAGAPSYCAGPFAVLDRAVAEKGSRLRRLHLVAHECAHVWWGHRVPTPILGDGGTWLREGLAEWLAIEVTGELLGAEAHRSLWRETLAAYLRGIDLRRRGGIVANEPALLDATYVHPARIAYGRGALVLRAMEHALGREPFRAALARFARANAFRFAGAGDFVRAVGAPRWIVAYYVESARLPDFQLVDIAVAPGRASARVLCEDAAFGEAVVPCLVRTSEGARTVGVAVRGGAGELRWEGAGTPESIEVDPERIWLDPIRSNSCWRAPP